MVDADVGLSGLFVANNVDTVTRGHSLKLFVQQSRIDAIDARKYFFITSCYTELDWFAGHTRRFFIFSVL